jgi:hypothetical protein
MAWPLNEAAGAPATSRPLWACLMLALTLSTAMAAEQPSGASALTTEKAQQIIDTVAGVSSMRLCRQASRPLTGVTGLVPTISAASHAHMADCAANWHQPRHPCDADSSE